MNTIVLRLGGLVVGIILARILTPEQFGVYAVALTVQGILLTIADLGLSAELVRSDDPKRVAPTVATIGLLSGLILTVITFASSGVMATLLGSPDASDAIAVLSFTLVLGGATVVPYAMLVREFRQKELFFVGVVDFVVSTAVTLTLVALGFGVMGLAIGRVCAQVASSAMQFWLAKVRPRYGIDRTILRPVLAFSLPIAAANLLSWALLNADNIVLARVAGAAALGYYVLAFNISSWPMSALSQVMRSISLPYFARTKSDDGGLPMVTSIGWAGALPAGAVLAALSAPVIEIVYGAKWLPAAPVLAALGVYGSLRVVFDVFAGYLYAHGRSRPVLWIQIVWIVVLIGAMIPAALMFGIQGAAWVHVVVAIVVILPCYLLALRSAGVPLGGIFRSTWLPTIGALPAIAVAIACSLLIPNALVALLVGGASALAVYAAVMAKWVLGHVRAARTPVDIATEETT